MQCSSSSPASSCLNLWAFSAACSACYPTLLWYCLLLILACFWSKRVPEEGWKCSNFRVDSFADLLCARSMSRLAPVLILLCVFLAANAAMVVMVSDLWFWNWPACVLLPWNVAYVEATFVSECWRCEKFYSELRCKTTHLMIQSHRRTSCQRHRMGGVCAGTHTWTRCHTAFKDCWAANWGMWPTSTLFITVNDRALRNTWRLHTTSTGPS